MAWLALTVAAVLTAPLGAQAQEVPQPQQDEPAQAQDSDGGEDGEFAEPSPEQLDLNEEAVEALAAGRYGKAVSLLEESHFYGDLNVTYLNLGRAYQRLGECDKAREALEAVDTAPPVSQPPPALVAQKAREYLQELEQECEEPEVEPVEESANAVEPPADDSTSDGGNSTLWGAATLGTGVAMAGAGLGLHLWAESVRDEVRQPQVNDDDQIVSLTQIQAQDRETSANTLDTIALSSIVGGALLSGVGTFLLLAEPEEGSGLAVDFSGEDATIKWSTRF